MIKIYGIPNCNSVKKALDFIKSTKEEFEFIDFKKTKPSRELVESWAKAVMIEKLFNTKGTKYRSSNLDFKAMGYSSRIDALVEEPTMIKRPVIEYNGKTIVGFDEDLYTIELVK